MAKIDSQGRLSIPSELIERLSYQFRDINCAICYIDKDTFYIIPENMLGDTDCIISLRKIDSKGRIYIPKDILNLWKYPKIVVVYLNDGKIFFVK